MYGVKSIKFTDAQQTKAIYNFKNIKKNFVGPKELFGVQAPEIHVGSLVVDKLPEDSTLVLKVVRVGTECGVCFVMYIIVF
jgi:hypothetical protein